MTFPQRIETIDPELGEVLRRDDGVREIDWHDPIARGWFLGHLVRAIHNGLAVKITPLEGPRAGSVRSIGGGAGAGQETRWHWYAGTDAEAYPIGPCASREEALAAAVGHDSFEDPSGGTPVAAIYIVEARTHDLRIADFIATEQMLELVEEAPPNLFHLHEDDEGPFFDATEAQQADLLARLRQACDDWQNAHGLTFTTHTFAETRNEELVQIAPSPVSKTSDQSGLRKENAHA
ncbi:hypothetical protein SAMN05877809_105267 [Rhodobacter sp. JA431]|uniref:hypothetical protein n=1 Tax=Rhodobacter sp. JA431 TaxID=570013 RepID=UPI000BCB2271|nr:hypothetical protein [Rhodobacter sp. JA431]SOC11362.1 hypothetical protein SAMN05877809_105267 [Rhodobacter sp. JA431]